MEVRTVFGSPAVRMNRGSELSVFAKLTAQRLARSEPLETLAVLLLLFF